MSKNAKSQYAKSDLDKEWVVKTRLRNSMIKTRSMNKLEQVATSKTSLPELKTNRSHSTLIQNDQFHSRPDEKDYKMIPSVFLPLEGGPVLVFGN